MTKISEKNKINLCMVLMDCQNYKGMLKCFKHYLVCSQKFGLNLRMDDCHLATSLN
jgi:hypothetical protein